MEQSQNKKWLYLAPLILFIAMVGLLYSGLGKDPTELESQLIGKPIPAFDKETLSDPQQRISQSDLKGPALLNVFASWCPACYAEHPYLMQLQSEGAIKIYGVNYKDSRPKGLKFIRDLGNPYDKIIFDNNGRLGIELGVYGAPETFVINAKNEIIYRHVGVVDERVWKTIIQPKLLGEGAS